MSGSDLREMLGRALALSGSTPPHVPGDEIAASVLVPVVLAQDPFLLLTRRSPLLRQHPNQVSFPGGRIDVSDDGPEGAALREAREEIGLDPNACSIVGRLPPVPTSTGFTITPVVACVRPDAVWKASPAEVAEILVLPATALFDLNASRRERAMLRGIWREYWVWDHPDHVIWGATAAILSNLAERLRRVEALPRSPPGIEPLDLVR